MTLDSLMYSPGHAAYYTDSFRAVLEDHLTFLRRHPETLALPMLPMNLYRFEADLYGLFTEMKIPPQYHYVVMRLNGWDSPLHTPQNLKQLILPPYAEVDKIRQAHVTEKRLK